MIYMYEKGGNPLSPLLAADATMDESRTDTYTATKYPIEAQANISDYVVKEPKEYNCTVRLTASRLGREFSKDNVKSQLDALVQKADARTELSVVFDWWVFDAIVTNITSNHSFDIGEGLEISLTFQTIERAQFQTTQIPPSRLKSKVKRKRANTKKGAAETKKDAKSSAKARAKTQAIRIGNFLGFGR